MSEQEKVNEKWREETVNRFKKYEKDNRDFVEYSLGYHAKLSEQEKAILECLTREGFLSLHYKTSKDIAYYLLEKKHGKQAYELNEYSSELDMTKEQFNSLSESEKEEYMRKHRFAHGTGKFLHAYSRLPHFLAELKNSDPLELTLDDLYDVTEGYYSTKYHTKKELLREANSIRASVCRSLKRLTKRGLVVSLTVTKAISIMGRRNKRLEKTYYFLSKQQAERHMKEGSFNSFEYRFNEAR